MNISQIFDDLISFVTMLPEQLYEQILFVSSIFSLILNQDVRVNMPVYAESINIAAGLLPGFGPVVQIPASFIFKNFPEEGLVNKILFGEFPPLDVNNKDEWTKALGLKPAWADKFIKLIFNQGENASFSCAAPSHIVPVLAATCGLAFIIPNQVVSTSW